VVDQEGRKVNRQEVEWRTTRDRLVVDCNKILRFAGL
jgi:hypothetical protein